MGWLNFVVVHRLSTSVIGGVQTRPIVGGPYSPGGVKLVVDATGSESSKASFDTYLETRNCPHFTLSVKDRLVYQHIDTDLSAPVISVPQAPHQRGNVIWVMVTKHEFDEIDADDAKWVGEQVRAIAKNVGVNANNVVPFLSVNEPDRKAKTIPLKHWPTWSGICGASSVPSANRNGPGVFDFSAFMQGFGLVEDTVVFDEGVEDSAELLGEPEQAVSQQEDVPEVFEGLVFDLPPYRGRPIKEGSSGKAVLALQKAFGLKETGKYDEGLYYEIVAFQEVAGLEATGIVDADTWSAMQGFS